MVTDLRISYINKTQILLKVFFWFHEVLNFLKNDGKMFKYSKRLDDVLITVGYTSWKQVLTSKV
jgi:hypothetical protein